MCYNKENITLKLYKEIQMIRTKKNPFHAKNVYIDFDTEDIDVIAHGEFKEISKTYHAPLQMMLDSEDNPKKRDFIKEHGFKKMRTCYSMTVRKDSLISRDASKANISHAREGEAIYEELAKCYYAYYKKTHESINPLTVDFDTFKEVLTKDVYYNMEDETVLAFVEDDEIAYVYASKPQEASGFYISLCEKLFNDYEQIYFEADDVDVSAIELKKLFKDGVDEITETWVYSIADE